MAVLLLASAALAMGDHARVSAQAPWVISGIVRPGPGSTATGAGARVQLLEVREGPTVAAEALAIGGRFRFEVRPDPSVTYLVRVVVDGVSYLAPNAVTLSAQQPSASVEVVVYPVTQERPSLRSIATAITIVSVDRGTGQTTLQREDVIVNPGTTTWTGEADGVALRLPLPEGAISAEGQAWYLDLPSEGDFAADDGALKVVVPIRPGETLLITRFVVPYDASTDAYELKLTAALPTDRMQIFAPDRFSERVVPGDEGVRGEPMEIEGERMLVVERLRGADAGDTLSARVVGLAGRNEPNPLTERFGAALGLVVALAVTVGVSRFRRAPSGALRPEHA